MISSTVQTFSISMLEMLPETSARSKSALLSHFACWTAYPIKV